jgi:hypothetical protein
MAYQINYQPLAPIIRKNPAAPDAQRNAQAAIRNQVAPAPTLHAIAFADFSGRGGGTVSATAFAGYQRGFTIGRGPNDPPNVRVRLSLQGQGSFDGFANAGSGIAPWIFPPLLPLIAPASFSGTAACDALVIGTGLTVSDSQTEADTTRWRRNPPVRNKQLSGTSTAVLQTNRAYVLGVDFTVTATASVFDPSGWASNATRGRAIMTADWFNSASVTLEVLEGLPEIPPNYLVQLQSVEAGDILTGFEHGEG